jgi:RNA polymerase sigma-70 factor (ECF subfamily)
VGGRPAGRGADTDDDEAIALVTAGDPEAYRVLVERYGALAQRTAVLLGAGSDADDVVQEAFVRAFQALPRFRRGEPFRPWLLRIVVNQAHNARRSRQRARAAGERDLLRYSPVGADEPADRVLSVERREALLRALAGLSAADREVLACRYLLDLSEAETASVLRLPKGTVKSRTSRALDRVRSVLAGQVRVEAGDG